MNAQEIESLLRKAHPPELPPGWKQQILRSAVRHKSRPVVWCLSWQAVAACWCLILFLRLTMPSVPEGNIPFDYAAFLARNARVERMLATGEYDPPPIEPLHIESIFRLPAPKSSPAS